MLGRRRLIILDREKIRTIRAAGHSARPSRHRLVSRRAVEWTRAEKRSYAEMSETSHRFGVFLPGMLGIGALNAESSRITQEW